VTYYVGADTGGTFTDLVVIDDEGRVHFDKAFSTPEDPSLGVVAALGNGAALIGLDVEALARATTRFAHGTTVGTNALIQRRGADVGLLMTQGFEDTTLITRGPMGMNLGIPVTQALDFARAGRPTPIVSADRIRGIGERVAVDGTTVTPLDEEAARTAIRALLDRGLDSIAVCLLWAFRNPVHEQRLREIVHELAPGLHVSLSAEVSPVMGEFERSMTTIVNAYVGPVISSYIRNLRNGLADLGLTSQMQIMKSSGGVTLPERVEKEAVALVNSGPIGGLVAAQHLGSILGFRNIITSDVGGTSFDVGLIRDGEFEYEQTPCLDQGVPVQTPAVKVVAVGAGGGSIAWTDGRRLHVGPQSAGADPGPACYGKSEDPTVTDALLVLGIIDPRNFFGGRKQLSLERAEDAIRRRVAEPLGMSVEEAAAGIYQIVTARMSDLIRKVTVESGYDPRDFVLFAYGGAGPAHAAVYAEALGVKELVIPHTSSVFSAFGCALSDVRFSFARSEPMILTREPGAMAAFDTVFEELEDTALGEMAASGHDPSTVTLVRRLDLRYEGQLNEMSIPWHRVPLADAGVETVREVFETQYETRFGKGTTSPDVPLEAITFRVDALRPTAKPALHEEPLGPEDAAHALLGTREIYLDKGGRVPARIYDGNVLRPGNVLMGPAVIERRDTTVLLPAGHRAAVDGYQNLRIKASEG
jgi:N-methylhydantoinase A